MRTFLIGGVISLGAILAACGGGTVAPQSGRGPTASVASVTFTITLNQSGTSSTGRTAKFIDAATQSLTIALTALNGASPAPAVAPTTVNVGTNATGCTTANGTTTCTVNVGAVVGNDTYTVTAYAQPNGGGSALSTGSTTVTIAPGGPNSGALALGGIPASIAVSVTNGNNQIPGGYATTLPVVVSARDAAGATIIGAYANPITLTNADTSSVTTLSTTSVASSSTAVTLSYAPSLANGGFLKIAGLPVGATQIGASAQGVSASSVTPGTFQYISDIFSGFGIPRTLTGTASVTVTSYSVSGTPLPNPSTFSYTITNVSQSIPGAPFNGLTVTDTNEVMTISQTAPVTSTAPEVETLDVYRAITLTPTGAIRYRYGQSTADVNSGTATSPLTGFFAGTTNAVITYPTPGASVPWQEDVLPFASVTWSNTGVPFTETYSNAQVATFQLNADGSTAFTQTFPTPATLTQTATGSAVNFNNCNGCGVGVTTTISLPVPASPPATGFIIPVAQATTSPAPGATTKFSAADWYPGGGAPVPPLWSYTLSQNPVTIPASCNVPASIGTQAWVVVYQSTRVRADIFEYRQETQNDYYIPGGVGWVCHSDNITSTGYRFGNGLPLAQTVISIVYGVQSASALGAPTQSGNLTLSGAGRSSTGHTEGQPR